jgi:hypothetical protein
MKSASLKSTHTPPPPSGAMSISRILPIIYLIIDVYILVTLKSMNVDNYPCKCAVTSQVKKIINIIIAMIVSGLALLVIDMVLFYYYMSSHNMALLLPVMLGGLFVTGIQIYYSYLLITYVNTLVNTNCECVSSTFKNGLKTYGYFRIITSSLSALMVLFATVFMIYAMVRK